MKKDQVFYIEFEGAPQPEQLDKLFAPCKSYEKAFSLSYYLRFPGEINHEEIYDLAKQLFKYDDFVLFKCVTNKASCYIHKGSQLTRDDDT